MSNPAPFVTRLWIALPIALLAACGEEPRFWQAICQDNMEVIGDREAVARVCEEQHSGTKTIRPVYDPEADRLENLVSGVNVIGAK